MTEIVLGIRNSKSILIRQISRPKNKKIKITGGSGYSNYAPQAIQLVVEMRCRDLKGNTLPKGCIVMVRS